MRSFQTSSNIRPKIGLLFLLALLLNGILASCGNSDDTPLSDDEKIQRANRGREDYQKAMQGGQKPGVAAPTGGK